MKKIKTLLFMLTIMLIGFVGINNVHAAENYGLWVNGEEFTSEKTTIDCGEGTATFDKSTNTLTLNNATIAETVSIVNSAAIYTDSNYDNNLKIVLVGENTITVSQSTDEFIAAIYRAKGNLTINGDGILNINNGATFSANNSNLIIDNTTINMHSDFNPNEDYGVSFIDYGNVTINNSDISITGSIMYGIHAQEQLNINNSSISINSTTKRHSDYDVVVGIHASRDIYIDENSNIKIIEVDEGISARETQYEGDIDRNIVISDGAKIEISTKEAYLSNGITITSPLISGNIKMQDYSGKIMIGYKPNGINADLYTKSEFLNLYKEIGYDELDNPTFSYNSDIKYLKMGNFDTYSINNNVSPENMMYLPENAFEGEIINVNDSIQNNYEDVIYSLGSVKILKASDNSDVTSDVNYNSVSKTFEMPNYSVVVKTTFKQSFPAPNTAKVILTSYNSAKLSWSSVYKADGYYVYYKAEGYNYALLGKTSWNKLYYNKTKMLQGKKYYFKIVPYVDVHYPGKSDEIIKEVKSNNYKVVSIYTLKKMAVPTVTKYNNSKVKVKWSKINGPTGYEVYRSKTKTGNFVLLKRLSSSYSSYTFKTTKNVNYYYKVRAYKLVDGKRIYAPFSNVKAFKLK